jgi:hypothetical protein
LLLIIRLHDGTAFRRPVPSVYVYIDDRIFFASEVTPGDYYASVHGAGISGGDALAQVWSADDR